METSDTIAIVALITASAAFGLEVRRWFEAGVRLRLSVIPDALMIPNTDDKKRLCLTVINRGLAPTTISHFIALGYKTPFHRFLKKGYLNANVNQDAGAEPLPKHLAANTSWLGVLVYTPQIEEIRSKGQLYVGVVGHHRDKMYLKKVPKPKKERVTDKLKTT